MITKFCVKCGLTENEIDEFNLKMRCDKNGSNLHEMGTQEITDIGNKVLCDLCSKDYTNSDEQGGFLFMSKGVCPDCVPRFLASVKKYGEEKYIRATCPEGMSFREFSLKIRGGDNRVIIQTFDNTP